MTYIVIVKDKGVSEILDIVKELQRLHGLQLNEDFEFSYHPPEFDFMNPDNSTPRHTKFVFKNAKFTTFFTLKYGT